MLTGGAVARCCKVGEVQFICDTWNLSTHFLLTWTLRRQSVLILSPFTTHCLLPPRIQHQLRTNYLLNNQSDPSLNFVGTQQKNKRGAERGCERGRLQPPPYMRKESGRDAYRAWRRDETATPGSAASPPPVNTWMKDTRGQIVSKCNSFLVFTYPSSVPNINLRNLIKLWEVHTVHYLHITRYALCETYLGDGMKHARSRVCP